MANKIKKKFVMTFTFQITDQPPFWTFYVNYRLSKIFLHNGYLCCTSLINAPIYKYNESKIPAYNLNNVLY